MNYDANVVLACVLDGSTNQDVKLAEFCKWILSEAVVEKPATRQVKEPAVVDVSE